VAAVWEKAGRAARLWGTAEVSREAIGAPLPLELRVLYEPYMTAARSQLGDEAWEEALTEGRAMSLEETAQYALSDKEEISSPPDAVPEQPSGGTQATPLTSREQEIAALVARGMTNRQIATELVISEHTEATHIRRIFKKLGFRSRAELAAWVSEQ
jgi:DNA-binding NarL/FixJ family response regulator